MGLHHDIKDTWFLFHYQKIVTMLLSCNFVESILIFPTKAHTFFNTFNTTWEPWIY